MEQQTPGPVLGRTLGLNCTGSAGSGSRYRERPYANRADSHGGGGAEHGLSYPTQEKIWEEQEGICAVNHGKEAAECVTRTHTPGAA